jgi:ERCC4-type nuclease
MMRILIDTREQDGHDFDGYDCTVATASLPTGDYSLDGLAHRIAIERKSLADLIGCLTGERSRFERELARGKGLDLFCVVIEASFSDLTAGNFRSRMNPHAAAQSLIAFQVRYGTSFMWAGSRQAAEYLIFWTLQKYLSEATKTLAAITKAHGAAVGTGCAIL